MECVAHRFRNSEDWCTVGSIVCSPFCSTELLQHIGTGIAKEPGYGYLLRVIARHKNVNRVTLQSIAEDPSLEKRYTEVAQAALEGGSEQANRQI